MAILNNDDGKKDKKTNRINQMREAVSRGILGQNYDLNVPKMDMPVVDQPSTFTSFSDVGREYQQSVPSYNVDGLFSQRMSMTPDPERDAAQEQRLRKSAKFNALSKGLQLLFSGIIASRGDIAPAPYDSGTTQAISNAMQNLDDRYFQELAQVRDLNLRANLFNADQERRGDEARLQKMKDEANRQYELGDLNKAREIEQAMFDEEMAYKYAALAQEGKLRGRGYDLESLKQYNYGQNNKLQTIDDYNDAIRREQDQLKIMQAGLAEEADIEAQNKRVKVLSEERDNLLRQLSGREGFSQPKQEENEDSNVLDLDALKLSVIRGKVNPQDAIRQIEALAPKGREKEVRALALREFDMTEEDMKKPIEKFNPEDYEAGKQNIDDRAKQRLLSQKMGQLDTRVQEIATNYGIPASEIATLMLDDPNLVTKLDSLIRKYGGEKKIEAPYSRSVGITDLFNKTEKSYHPDNPASTFDLRNLHRELLLLTK